MASRFRLIVGLGNPGRDYADTRHNVGFMVLDRLAAWAKVSFRMEKKWQAEVAAVGDVWLCKPQTYMNLSGESTRAIGQFYKIEPSSVLVVFDDMALPLGRLRLRESGSAGGHNGLSSVIQHLGTNAIPRLRVGIGGADPGAAVGHVLGRFSPAERKVLDEVIHRSAEAVEFAQSQGFATAMNRYNQNPTTQN
jgi:peptidyl-tRNA hydrolase, PTH1 family